MNISPNRRFEDIKDESQANSHIKDRINDTNNLKYIFRYVPLRCII